MAGFWRGGKTRTLDRITLKNKNVQLSEDSPVEGGVAFGVDSGLGANLRFFEIGKYSDDVAIRFTMSL